MRLTGRLRDLDDEDDVGAAVARHIVGEARAQSADLADAIEACAIPRRFDAEILGVLIGTPGEPARNERLLEQLAAYSFVRARQTGGYTFHDRVREPLLAMWREPDRVGRFEELTDRLVDHHVSAHEAARLVEEDAARVSMTIRKASPERFRRLADALEVSLLDPLTEAVYQRTLVSPDDALVLLQGHLYDYEDRGWLGGARLLVAATREIVRKRDHESRDRVLAWLSFWDGRLLRQLDRYDEAATVLEPLIQPECAEDLLRYWALGELGLCRQFQLRLREAQAAFEEEVRLDLDTECDLYNLPTSYMRLGGIHLELDRPDLALVEFGRAIDAARALEQDEDRLILSFQNRAEAELALNDFDAARDTLLEALDTARTAGAMRRTLNTDSCDMFARCFMAGDWALAETCLAEREAIAAGFGDVRDLVRRLLSDLEILWSGGRLRRARELAGRLQELLAVVDSPALLADGWLGIGRLSRGEGRLERALEEVGEAARAAKDSAPSTALQARAERARILGELERWDEAAETFTGLAEAWREAGNELMAVLAEAECDAVRRRLGAGPRAYEPYDFLPRAGPEVRLRWLTVRAEEELAAGYDAGAAAAWREAVALGAMPSPETARAHERLAGLGGAEAAEHGRRAAAEWAGLVARDRSFATAARALGDRENAAGLRRLLGTDPEALTAARDHYKSALDAYEHPWYALNAGYLALRLADWRGAVEMFQLALERAEYLRRPPLLRRLAECHLERGQALLAAGAHEAAGRAFEDSLDRLKAPEQQYALPALLLGLGDARRATGDADGAREAYGRAGEAGDPTALLRIGEVLAGEQRAEEAIEAFSRAAAEGGTDVAVEATMSVLEMMRGSTPGEREPILGRARELVGTDGVVAIADRLDAVGCPDAAEQALALVADESPDAGLRLAALLRRRGDEQGAREAYARLAAGGADGVAARASAALAELLGADGDRDGAIDAYRRALSLASVDDLPRAGLGLGELLAAGDARDAEAVLRATAQTEDVDAAEHARLRLAELLDRRGAGDEAGDLYRGLLTSYDREVAAAAAVRLIDRESPPAPGVLEAVLRAGARACLDVAQHLRDRGEDEAAAELLRRAADLTDDLYAPDAALMLGDVLAALGDGAGAAAEWTRAALSEDADVAPKAVARLLDSRADGADELVDRVVEQGGATALTLARRLAERGDYVRAERALRRLADADDVFAPDGSLELGDLLAHAEEWGRARDAYRRAESSGESWVASAARQRLDYLDAAEEEEHG